MDNPYLLLEKEFCPPLDSSLFSAIVLDYDHSNASAIADLRSTLEVLKESALAEESAIFDPSGSSDLQYRASSCGSSDRVLSWHGDAASSVTEETDLTGISHAFDAIGLGTNQKETCASDSGREQYAGEVDAFSPEQKSQKLKEMFPQAKDFDINYILKKAGYDYGRAVEELLSQAFFQEEDLTEGGANIKKGVEAFTEPAINGRGRRARGKKRQILRRTSSTPATHSETQSSPAPHSRWDRAKEDVDFIAQRTHIPPRLLSSTYHKNGASLPSTIAALCSADPETFSNPYLSESSDAVVEAHAAELCIDFQNLPYSQLLALVRLTHPSTASAHELARALAFKQSQSSTDLVPQYLPRPPTPTNTSSTHNPVAFSTLSSADPAALATTRSNAFTQAQAAYRKSKSKPLMGGAAAYYSSVGRDASASLRRHEAAAADSLVTRQSKLGEIDLHGINVKDAVTILRQRVETWWEAEGREWARQGKVMMGKRLRVITGVGRHSEGGRGRIGPAVGAMLVREGWKVEVGEGVIDVVGRTRG